VCWQSQVFSDIKLWHLSRCKLQWAIHWSTESWRWMVRMSRETEFRTAHISGR
jgi:hypothetical protein